MDANIILAILVFSPVVILTFLRANAATAFLALCLGSVLGSFVAKDLVSLLKGYIAPATDITETIASLVLLWLPVLLVAIFMMKTIAPKQRLVNLIPAFAVGILGALLSVPFLTPDIRASVMASDIWKNLDTYKALVVVIGTVVSLGLLRMRKKSDDHKSGKHH
jgi:hypothetical protein